jgi:hypothetical protein
MMMELLESDDPAVVAMLAAMHHVFVPIANPDGCAHATAVAAPLHPQAMRECLRDVCACIADEFSWGPNRLWRKNRAAPPASNPTCFGVDLNVRACSCLCSLHDLILRGTMRQRNWQCGHWSGPGSSANPCSDVYHGPGPMSEPEVQAIERLLMETVPSLGYTLVGAIDWHSFGQLILGPYGYTSQAVPPNDEDVRDHNPRLDTPQLDMIHRLACLSSMRHARACVRAAHRSRR